jgi:DNA-binding PadR family transcriptional regulator
MSERGGRAPEPLRPRVFAILLALAGGPRHGYGLMQSLQEEPGERWLLGPATLYRTLKEMQGDGLITATDGPDEESGGPPRRYYRLTALGRSVGNTEAARMAEAAGRWKQQWAGGPAG